MAEIRQKMRGITAQLDAYLGSEGQIVVDIEAKTIRIHDGLQLGGYALPTITRILELFQDFASSLPEIQPGFGINVTGDWESANIQIAIDPTEAVARYELANVAINANALTDQGQFTSPAQMNAAINWPGLRHGTIHVNKMGTLVEQLYIPFGESDAYYRRVFAAGVWTAWIQFYQGAPKSITLTSINESDATGHTHALGFTPLQQYTGTDVNNADYPIGSVVIVTHTTANVARNSQQNIRLNGASGFYIDPGGTQLAGTWRARGQFEYSFSSTIQVSAILMQRTA